MYDITKLISKKQFEKLLRLLPTARQKKRGRKKCKKKALLNGILQVLINGVSWNNIANCSCSDTSCHRYFKELQRRGKLKLVYERLSELKTNIKEGAVDTTTVTSFRFKRMTGYDGKHKKWGTKISLFTDKKGLPVDVVFGKGNTHDSQFLPTHLRKTVGRRKEVLNLDKGYCNLNLRRQMRRKGTKINMPMRKRDYIRKKGPKFSFEALKYKVRFQVEKTFSWLKSFRRIRIRREYYPAMFKSFVYLGLIIILIRS
jgi:transposase